MFSLYHPKKNGSWDHVAPVVVIGHRYMGVLRPKHAPPVSIHICVVWDKAPQIRLDAPGSASWSVNFGNWAVRGLQNAMNLVPGGERERGEREKEREREREIIIYIYTCQFPIFNHIKSQFLIILGVSWGHGVSSIFSHPGTLHRATEALAALRIAVPFGQPFVTSLGGWGNASWVWNRGCPNNPQFIAIV